MPLDSKDEVKGKILFPPKPNDSEESPDPKNAGKTWIQKDEDGNEYETNDKETPDSEW